MNVSTVRFVFQAVVFMLLVGSLVGTPTTTSTPDLGTKCECGAFEGKVVVGDAKPILSQNPLNVTCDSDGKKMCQIFCTDLAKMSVERGPALLCAKILHAESIKPNLFTRVCGGNWEYGDFGVEKPICCHEGKSIVCVKA